MALIKCPECGKEISEFAAHCINCGCPMDKIKELLNGFKQEPHKPLKEKKKKGKYSELTSNIFYNALPFYSKKYISDFWEKFRLKQPQYYIKNHVHSVEIVSDDSVKPAFFFEKIKNVISMSYSISAIIGAKTTMKYSVSDTANLVGFANALVDNKSYKEVGYKEPKCKKRINTKKEELASFPKPPFSSTLSKEERECLTKFRAMIKDNYCGIEENDYPYLYSFKQPDKDFNMFWFTRDGKDLAFKYRSSIQKKEGNIKTIVALKYSPEFIFKIIASVLSSNPGAPNKKKQLLPINDLIINSIKGRNVQTNKRSSLAKDIVEYTTNAIYQKYKDLKRFNSREEFDRFKNRYSDYIYHGKRFSFKYPTESDATFIFEYYIASRLVGVIQSYERIVGKIIENCVLLLDSYYQLIINRDDSYRDVDGVNSNIASIPLEVFEKEVEKYFV